MAPPTPLKKTAAAPVPNAAAPKTRASPATALAVKKKPPTEKPAASASTRPPAVSSPASGERRRSSGSKKKSTAESSAPAGAGKSGESSRRSSKRGSHCHEQQQSPVTDTENHAKTGDEVVVTDEGYPTARVGLFPLVCFFGPPCSGKGTLAALLKERLGMLHLSTGELLRNVEKEEGDNSEIGAAMAAGKLVDDTVIVRLLRNAMAKNAETGAKGVILDGFPRNGTQVDVLREMKLWPDASFLINVPSEVLFKRMAARRVDPITGEVFGLGSDPRDEEQMKRLIRRDDDNADVLQTRIQDYEENMKQIARRLRGEKEAEDEDSKKTRGTQVANEEGGTSEATCELIEIDGDRDIQETFESVHHHLKRKFPSVFC
ncbi:adenylate kinase superfamily protein [Besnoitia besnoiti]|uniref:Adenylate kinase superfamily protein n=1 Tax=Besnoitia besnoiti TaxID=94643 RepID=A0A2A9M798_BESBE|nr:adenylate kinase superfamily protein [Besnoitia besnoiti]PFH31252.1 adenylate kinase superfamily protein [Besnoitia besnoiti]